MIAPFGSVKNSLAPEKSLAPNAGENKVFYFFQLLFLSQDIRPHSCFGSPRSIFLLLSANTHWPQPPPYFPTCEVLRVAT
jgi:hypothetical protein